MQRVVGRVVAVLLAGSLPVWSGAWAQGTQAEDATQRGKQLPWFCKGDACVDVLPFEGSACQYLEGDGDCRSQAKAEVLLGYFASAKENRYRVFSSAAPCQVALRRWRKEHKPKGAACRTMTRREFEQHLTRTKAKAAPP